MRRHRRAWLSSGVAVLVVAGVWIGSASAKTSTASLVPTYKPVFHQLLMGGEVWASGDYTLLVFPAPAEQTARLINQDTGQRATIRFGGAGCQVQGFAPSAVVWRCTGTGTGEAPDGLFAQNLPAGRVTKLPFNDGLAIGGADWLQFSFIEPDSEHHPKPRVFLNPATGQLVQDRSQVGGQRYPDLDSPGLFRTACRPVTVPGSYQARVGENVPGNLSFYGSVAVRSDVGDRGQMSLQRCGSHTITQIPIPKYGGQIAHNNRIIVWTAPLGTQRLKIDGVIPSTEQRFTIAVPTIVTDADEASVEINNRKLYISGPYDRYFATLPDSLQ